MTALIKVGEGWFQQYSDEYYNAVNSQEPTPTVDTARLIVRHFMPQLSQLKDPKKALLYAVIHSGLKPNVVRE